MKKNIEKDIEKLSGANFLQGSRLSSSHWRASGIKREEKLKRVMAAYEGDKRRFSHELCDYYMRTTMLVKRNTLATKQLAASSKRLKNNERYCQLGQPLISTNKLPTSLVIL
jgi:hypothetical protein